MIHCYVQFSSMKKRGSTDTLVWAFIGVDVDDVLDRAKAIGDDPQIISKIFKLSKDWDDLSR